jgi:Fe-S cluster assembly scaffold protein SufB
MTRGITEAEAKQLIIKGFIDPVMPTNKKNREQIESLIDTHYT